MPERRQGQYDVARRMAGEKKETRPEQETAEQKAEREREEAFQRGIRETKQNHLFEYGWLDSDHATQQYVERLASTLRVDKDVPMHVHVSPDWAAKNATALPDGTIFVSAGLLRSVETEEELLGVLAHEYVHVLREHAKKIQAIVEKAEKKEETVATTILRSVGALRAHEYESDIRGAIELLQEAGVSPAGYRRFMEKAAEREKKRPGGGGIIHGAMKDRELNLSSIFKMYDIAETEKGLTPIDAERIRALEGEEKKRTFRDIVRRPADKAVIKQDPEKARQRRREQIADLPDEYLSKAIRAIYRYASSFAVAARDMDSNAAVRKFAYDTDDAVALKQALDRVRDGTVSPDLPEDERTLIAMFDTELRTNVPFFNGDDEVLSDFIERRDRAISSSADQDTLARLFREKGATQEPTRADDIWRVFAGLIRSAMKKHYFGFVQERKAYKGERIETVSRRIPQPNSVRIREFMTRWEPVCRHYFQKFHPDAEYDEWTFRRIAFDELKKYGDVAMSDFGLPEEAETIQPVAAPVREEEKEGEEEEERGRKLERREALVVPPEFIRDIAFKIVASSDYAGYAKRRTDIVVALQRALPDAVTASEWFQVVDAISSLVSTMFVDMGVRMRKWEAEKEKEEYKPAGKPHRPYWKPTSVIETIGIVQSEFLSPWIAIDIFSHGIQNFSHFKGMDAREKKLGEISVASFFRIKMLQKEFEKTFLVSDTEQQLLTNRLKVVGSTDLLFEDIDADFLFLANSYLYDKNFASQFLGPGESDYQRKNEVAQETLADLLVVYLSRVGDAAMVLREIDRLETRGFPAKELLETYADRCGLLADRFINELRDTGVDEMPKAHLERLIPWVYNPFLRQSLRRGLSDREWQSSDFNSKLDVVFPPSATGGAAVSDAELASRIVEEDMREKSEFAAIRKRLGDQIDRFLEESKKETGLGVLATALDPRFCDLTAFVRAALNSSKDESDLKAVIYDSVKGLYRLPYEELEEYATLSKSAVKQYAAEAHRIVRTLYLLSDPAKYALLRKILADREGFLPQKEKRDKLLGLLFTEWVVPDEGEKDLSAIFQKSREAMVSLKEWEPLYFALQGLFAQYMAQPPRRAAPWDTIRTVRYDLSDIGASPGAVRGAVWKSVSPDAEKRPWRYVDAYRDYADRQVEEILRKEGMLAQPAERKSVTPLQFVKEIASNIGSLGVRFLQLLPFVVELPKKYETEFNTVYDNVRGQSKFAALLTAEREWPDFWDVIPSVGKRVGGGSIVTVYEAACKAGYAREGGIPVSTKSETTPVVMKVRNPNLKLNLDDAYAYVGKILDYLAVKYGGAYKTARVVLDDIKAWIERDSTFEGFLTQDVAFRNRYQGYRPKGFAYQARIPVSLPPENKFFSVEEFVRGTNLTQWDALVENGHDMKEVVGLLTQCYFDQIQKGFAMSDVHIGNFAVTDKKEVVFFDRNFFLEFSDEEKNLIQTLFVPGDRSRKVESVRKYFGARGIAAESAEQSFEAFVDALESHDASAVQRSIIAMREAGIDMPTKIMLLFKNLQSLHRFSQKAGFENVLEALAYQPALKKKRKK